MKKTTLFIFSFSLILLLAACTPPEPTMFGVPASTWNTLTPKQKQEVIKGYNDRTLVQEENAPLQNAISTAGTILNNNIINR